MRLIEKSNHVSRLQEIAALPVDAVSGFTPAQVRSILAASPRHNLRAAGDLRNLGCPDSIFQHLVESRAKLLGIQPAPPAPKVITDQDRKLAAEHTARLIANDTQPDLAEIYQESF